MCIELCIKYTISLEINRAKVLTVKKEKENPIINSAGGSRGNALFHHLSTCFFRSLHTNPKMLISNYHLQAPQCAIMTLLGPLSAE